MEQALVSIIIPIYNVEAYLDKCVESACNQTYAHLEIILVDDGSPDGCPQKCDEWTAKDPRIKVIHKPNGGLSDARNAGLDMATGEYVYFLDGDDSIEPELVAKAVKHMGDDVDMVAFQFYFVYLDKPHKPVMYHNSGVFDLENEDCRKEFIFRQLLSEKVGWEAWSRMYRRSVIERVGLRFADNRVIFAEDLYFCLCYSLHARKVISIADVLYNYLQRENSIMGTDAIKLNVGRMNELGKAVLCHLKEHESCVSFVEMFPLIHYLIIQNVLLRAVRNGVSMRELPRLVMEDVQDKDFFLEQLKGFRKYKNEVYRILNSWNAATGISLVDYLLNRSYLELRLRSRSINRYHQIYERKTAAANGLLTEYKKFAKNKRKIYLIGTEDFGNIGDHEIGLAIVSFLRSRFPGHKVKEISYREYSGNLYCLKKFIKREDVIALTGGGNFGDVYEGAQKLREEIICNWPENLKIVFPETVHFTNTAQGATMREASKKIFTKENNVHLFLREQVSYNIARELYSCSCYLAPDIVLSQNKQKSVPRKKQILVCLRSDAEKAVESQQVEALLDQISEGGYMLKRTDLQLDYHVTKADREVVVQAALDQWRETQLVITDRLHGMIFAAITGTPCIAFGNYNHKVKGTYELIRYLPYVRYVESVEEAETLLPELLNMRDCRYDNAPLQPYFDELARVVKQYANN